MDDAARLIQPTNETVTSTHDLGLTLSDDDDEDENTNNISMF